MVALRTIMEQKDVEREAHLHSEIQNMQQMHAAFQHQMTGGAQQLESTLTQAQMAHQQQMAQYASVWDGDETACWRVWNGAHEDGGKG